MSREAILYSILTVCLVFFLFVLKMYRNRLRDTREELDRTRAELDMKGREMEVIRDVQKEIRASRDSKGPDVVEAAPEGDSDARIARLNRMSDKGRDG